MNINNLMMVFDSQDGTLKTSRMYTGGISSHDKLHRPIIISSGPTPVAYSESVFRLIPTATPS